MTLILSCGVNGLQVMLRALKCGRMRILLDVILLSQLEDPKSLCLEPRPTVALRDTPHMASNETRKVSIGKAQSLRPREH